MADKDKEIHIYFFGTSKLEFLPFFIERLENTFSGYKVIVKGNIPLIKEAYNKKRNQYLSDLFLRQLAHKETEARALLGITDVDLYTPSLNFVFGQAILGGKAAIISTYRLQFTVHGERVKQDLYFQRVLKEAIHELGHVFGLQHCPDPLCVMHFSNSILDVDKKKAEFCSHCRLKIR